MTICTPPNGCWFLRKCRNTLSTASSRSARTIDISSITRVSMFCITRIFCLEKRYCCSFVLYCASGMNGANESWKNEWMVTPSALMAAMPVGATTIIRLDDSVLSRRRKVVLPVPALPVRKRLVLVVSMMFHASCVCSFVSIVCCFCYIRGCYKNDITKVRKRTERETKKNGKVGWGMLLGLLTSKSH